MRALLLLALALLLAGCAGSGEGGRWTPQDTQAAIGAFDRGLDTYQHAQAIYHGQAYPTQ